MKLGEIVEIRKGKKPSEIVSEPLAGFRRLIQIDDLRPSAVPKYCPPATDEVKAIETDIVIAWDGANAATSNFGLSGVIGSTLAILRPSDSAFFTPYIGRFLRANTTYLRQHCKGATVPHIDGRILRELQIPKIPLDEQKRIAEVLDKADALREKRRLALQKLDTLLQSVFLEMFGDPVKNPKGWDVLTFESLLSHPLRNGISPSTNGKLFSQVLTLSAITRGVFDSSAVKDAFFAGKIPNDKYVNTDDFFICRGNGNLQLVGQGQFPSVNMPNTLFPDTIIAAKIDKDKIEPFYLTTLWSNPFVREQIERVARTTNGTFKINQTAIESIKIIVPSLIVQKKFDDFANQIRKIKEKYIVSLNTLENLFQSLQQRAFKGELFNGEFPAVEPQDENVLRQTALF